MPRGVITIQIKKRVITPSKKYKDKWKFLDILRMTSIRKGWFCVESKNSGLKFNITRDEMAFVKLILYLFGEGDYNILMFGKGKIRGFRRFWDGIIISEGKKFIRRREMSYTKEHSSVYEREGSGDPESYIGRFFKTKRPGIWHNF